MAELPIASSTEARPAVRITAIRNWKSGVRVGSTASPSRRQIIQVPLNSHIDGKTWNQDQSTGDKRPRSLTTDIETRSVYRDHDASIPAPPIVRVAAGSGTVALRDLRQYPKAIGACTSRSYVRRSAQGCGSWLQRAVSWTVRALPQQVEQPCSAKARIRRACARLIRAARRYSLISPVTRSTPPLISIRWRSFARCGSGCDSDGRSCFCEYSHTWLPTVGHHRTELPEHEPANE